MSLSVAVVDIATPTSTGNQTYTIGFQAVALIVIGNESSGTGTTAGGSEILGFGVSSSSQYCAGICESDAKASGADNFFGWQDPSNLIRIHDAVTGSATPIVVANINSITSTTFVLNFTTVNATARKVTVIALGGADLSGAEIVNFQEPVSTGNQNVTTTLGTPVGALFLSSLQNSTTQTSAGAAGIMSGWTFGSSANWVSSYAKTANIERVNACIGSSIGLTTVDTLATLSSFSNNQMTINWSAVQATTRFYTWALVLYGNLQLAGFSNTSPTSTGNQGNSLSFSPLIAFVQTLGQAASTGLLANAAGSFSAGLYDGTNDRVHAIALVAPGAKTNSVGKSYYQTSQSLEMYDTTVPTPVKLVEAAINSLSSTVQLNFTTVNATARQYIGWALSSANFKSANPSDTIGVSNPNATFNTAYFRALNDTVAISQSVSQLLSHLRNLSDVVSIAELIRPAASWAALAIDSLGISGVLLPPNVAWGLQPADSLGVSDIAAETVIWRRSTADNVTVSQGLSFAAILFRLLADTVAVSTVPSIQTLYNSTFLGDGVGVHDSPAINTAYYRTFLDNVAIGDLIGRQALINLTLLADKIGVQQGPIGLGFVKMLSQVKDNIGISDGFSVIRAFLRSLSDNVATSDLVPAPLDLPGWNIPGLADNITVKTFQPSFFIPALWTASVHDIIGVMDLVVNPVVQSKGLALIKDTIGISDQTTIQMLWRRLLRDTTALSDNVLRSQIALRLVSSIVGLSTGTAQSATFYRELVDMLAIADFATLFRSISILLTDRVGVATAEGHATIARRSVTDTVGVHDTALQHAILLRMVADHLGVSDAVERALIVLRALADAVGVSGHALLGPAIWRRALQEHVGLGDKALEAVIALRRLADSLGISDTTTHAGIYLRHLADTFALSDALQTITISDKSGYVEGDIRAVQGYVDGADAVQGYVDGADAVQ